MVFGATNLTRVKLAEGKQGRVIVADIFQAELQADSRCFCGGVDGVESVTVYLPFNAVALYRAR